MSQIIDGNKLAASLTENLKDVVRQLSYAPVFCDVLVGEHGPSVKYVAKKRAAAEAVGISFLPAEFPETITTDELITAVRELNQVPHMCGLIVQLPLPEHIDTQAVLDVIDPRLDVDCLGTQRSEDFYAGEINLVPPTAGAVLYILDSLNLDLSNMIIVVVGQGKLVGLPVTHLLKQRELKHIAVVDKDTIDRVEILQNADVIISAVGKPNLIHGTDVKQGVVVIDAGTAESGASLKGDVHYESVAPRSKYITPVPGGVGPLTVAMLLKNVVQVAQAD